MSITTYPYQLPDTGPKLIGFAGRAGSGKDTAGSYLHDSYEDVYKENFADTLKLAAAKLFGISPAVFYTSTRKEELNPFWKCTPRQLLQYVGTELFRNNKQFSEFINLPLGDFWVARMFGKLSGFCLDPDEEGLYTSKDIVCICDVRFPNEVKFIQENGGLVYWVDRSTNQTSIAGIPNHETEMHDLQLMAGVQTIDNNGTLENLYATLDSIIDQHYSGLTEKVLLYEE
jgi:hypothetical protein